MKAGSCAVCDDPRRAEIDQASITGSTVRDLATRFSRSKNTIQKHVAEHIPAAVQKALGVIGDVDAGDAILTELQHLKNEAIRLQAAAEKKTDLRAAISALRELREAIELTAKIVGQIHENEINFNVQIDDATAARMAELYLARRATAGIQPVVVLTQVIANEDE